VTRYIRWQILLILLGVVLLVVLLTYLAINYTTVLRPGYGGTYVEGVAGYPRHLTPLLSGFNPADRDLCSLIFSGLTRLNEQGEVEPDLASRWEIAPDGTTYTFQLRPNAYWHDGTPVTADDVILTIRLLQDPEFPGPAELGGNMWRTVKIEEVDRRTVRFKLAEPYAPFLDYTTVGIVPSHRMAGTYAIDLPSAEFNLAPVGSGPFQVAEIESEDGAILSIILEQFPRHYRARPYLDRIQFRFYPSHRAALRAYEEGEVEGVDRVTADDLARAREFSDLNLFSAQIAEYAMVLLNLDRADAPFFQEQEVRQALMHALDRERIVSEALAGQGMVSNSPILPGTWAYRADTSAYRRDLERAAELLDEAGWVKATQTSDVRHKSGVVLAFVLLTSNDPQRVAVAEMLARQWADIGIDVTVDTVSDGEIRQALEDRDFQAALVHLRLPGDPDPYPFWHETQIDKGQNYAGFVHRRMSEVTERARVTVSRSRREELYDEFQVLFAEQLPSLPLYVPVYTYGVDERINDVQIGPLMHPSDRFRTILDWWIVHRRVFVSEAEVRPGQP
jgi:peptide/nickel transport system substrate-binding protein